MEWERPDFAAAHTFFDTQYDELEGIINQVAERIRAVDHYVEGIIGDYLKLTHLNEKSGEGNTSSPI